MRGREKSRFSTIFGSACQARAWRTEGIIPDPHCRKQCAAAVIRDRCGKDGLPLDIQRPRSPFRVKKNAGARAGGEECHKSPATPQTMRRHAFMRSGGSSWFSPWFGFQTQAWQEEAAGTRDKTNVSASARNCRELEARCGHGRLAIMRSRGMSGFSMMFGFQTQA